MNAQPAPFTRQTHNTSYLAYERTPSKKPVPVRVGDGVENMRVHPDVFIREYTSIKIAEISDARATNQRTPSLHVTLDASSVQTDSGKAMRENFGGSIQAGGELENALRYAHVNGIAMYVAIETKRKYKGKSSGEVISYLTPINELRGATPDGKGTEKAAGMTRENCSNVIVAVGPADDPNKTFLSPEAVTDPTTWEAVRSNRDGTLPPTGYARAINEAGDPTGAIIPKADLPTGAGPAQAVDVEALAEALHALMAKNAGPEPQQSGNTPRPASRTAKSVEGKAWDAFNGDGRVNPGSYLLGEIRNTRSGAISLIENAVYAEQALAESEGRAPRLLTAEQISAAATALVRPLLWAADQVQVHVTGGKVDRMVRSHTEAGKWIHQIASRHLPYSLEMVGDSDEARTAAKAWLSTVVAAAKQEYELAMTLVTEYCDEQYGPATPPNDASRAGARMAQRQNPPQDPTPSAPPATADAATESAASEPSQPSEPVGQSATAPEPQQAPTETPAPVSVAQNARPATASDTPDLVKRWNTLLDVINMGAHHYKLEPLLVTMFNTADLRQIPASAFDDALTAWEANPPAFTKIAGQAFIQANDQQKISA
jgi:hypothetical protein